MNGFFGKLGMALRKFMAGRYGTDKLNMAILCTGLVFTFLSMLIPVALVKMIFTTVSYAFMILAICRSLSRNIYKRYEENRKFLVFFQQIKDKDHRYYTCPRCRQQVRVPKGKISSKRTWKSRI